MTVCIISDCKQAATKENENTLIHGFPYSVFWILNSGFRQDKAFSIRYYYKVVRIEHGNFKVG